MQAVLDTIRTPLQVVSAVVIGLLAGAMLLIKVVLVPFWRGSPPGEFRAWFTQYSARIRALMGPLGAAGLATAAASTAAEAQAGTNVLTPATATAASAAIVAVTLSVNEPMNARFVEPDLDDEETQELLGAWARWHDVRVALGLVATGAAIATTRRR